MAFHHRQPPPITTVISSLSFLALLLTSPTTSLNCPSQNFNTNNLYTNCTILPTLNASLHWTYASETSSVSVAFVAPPPSDDNGWIAWAINPTRAGMAGSQALVAFKDANGSMTVRTYNVSSYSSLVEGRISFEVPEMRAEFSGGSMKIFATVRLPEEMAASEVNHVWQVGGSVKGGKPVKHEFLPENLKAVGKLRLRSAAEEGRRNGGGTAVAGSPVSSPVSSPSTAGSLKTGMFYVCFMVVIIIAALIAN